MDKGTAVCAPGRPTETDLDYISDDSSSGGGLSDGAKAGIGVGAVVGAAIIIGGLAWLCIHKRRERRRTATQPSGGSNQQHEEAAVATEVSHSSRPPQAGHGLTRDYFGPNPAAGPYTETSGHHSIAASSPGPYRAVPSRPEQPGDIAAPVEIDSARSEYSPMSSPSFQGSPQPQQPSTIDGRFELYGSTDTEPLPRSPSTMPTAVAHQARQEDRG